MKCFEGLLCGTVSFLGVCDGRFQLLMHFTFYSNNYIPKTVVSIILSLQ